MNNNKKILAIILLVFFLIGAIGTTVALISQQNALATTCAFVLILSGIGSYFLKKQVQLEQDFEREKNKEENKEENKIQ